MKIFQQPTYEWKTWFAWYPVWSQNGELLWMETIERKLENSRMIPNVVPSEWTIYRRIDNQPKNTNFAINS